MDIFSVGQHYDQTNECLILDTVDNLAEEAFSFIASSDPLKACLIHFNFEYFDIDGEVDDVNSLLKSAVSL